MPPPAPTAAKDEEVDLSAISGLKPISSEALLEIEYSASAVAEQRISHALVLPDQNFLDWYRAAEAYTKAFSRVAVVRSPAGNDLNRFRNVSAVEAPNVWLENSAVAHIRRVYPNVVRVDVLRAATPAQLGQFLQRRIAANDRFGETQNADNHLFDRFVLDWPAEALPGRIVLLFNADLGGGRKHEGIDVYAPVWSLVRAAVSGVVVLVVRQPTALGYGQYVQVSTLFGSQQYLVTYARLNDIRLQRGQQVRVGDVIGVSDGDNIKIVVQQPGGGLPGYLLPNIVNPTDLIYWDALRLQPTDTGLRVRKRPGTEFEILAEVGPTERLEALETHGRTLAKTGQQGQWINVRTPGGITGYSAAWFLDAFTADALDRFRLGGVNLDVMERLGKPAPDRLKGLGWVRLPYNVSFNPDNSTFGNTDLAAAFRRYKPYIEQCARAGLKVMLVITHQTYGEGQEFIWDQMNSERWRQLIARLSQMLGAIAGQYANQNLVHAYQIWNEQDAPPNSPSSVSMPAGTYAFMLAECIRAIRAVDTRARIITGGHVTGPASGANYARQALAALPPGVKIDGVACHSYGRGPQTSSPYAAFGHIDDEVRAYSAALPNAPLWITEWGVLDRPNDSPAAIAEYAGGFLKHLKARYLGRVHTAIWYAWAEGMHNGYGLVDRNDRPRQVLYDAVTKA